MGVANATVEVLRSLGHDVEHVRDIGKSSISDSEILMPARTEGRTVLTFDLDFGDLMAAAGEALPSVVIVRTRNQRPGVATPRIVDVAGRFRRDLESGAVVIIEDSRCRLRRLPLG